MDNAEWYNRVCGNVFSVTEGTDGMELAPRASDVNTNAYYFVDVVAESLAPVYFVADGGSRLGNPVLIAQAGETNRVPLLIGATYSVTSDVPLRVFAPAAAVVEAQAAEGRFRIGWPVSLGYSTADGMSTPTVSEAERLQGTFLWTGGCCVRHVGDALRFCCAGCGCGGCTAYVNYVYEGYLLAAPGPSCGCSSQGGGMPHVETDAGGGEGNFWFVDGARSDGPESLWSPNSTMSWMIPVGWHRKTLSGGTNDFPVARADVEDSSDRKSRPLLIGGRMDVYKQVRHIDSNGVYRTDKFGHWISRSPECRIILDGETLQWTHPSH